MRRIPLHRAGRTGSSRAAAWSAGWLTCSRIWATLRGLRSSDMSMMRAAPTASAFPPPVVPWVYSSNSRMYGLPPAVNGSAFWGIEADFQVSRLISRVCGLGLRAWISLVCRA